MIVVVIPAYKPEKGLLSVTAGILEQTEYSVLVVNDGSGSEYDSVFAQLPEQVTVLHHDVNRGKGAALKTAYEYIKGRPEYTGVITADADGQHLVRDIIRVGEALGEQPEALILGSREFVGNVPARSRFGNTLTRFVFRISSGVKVNDTQTGLRAFGACWIEDMLAIEGQRYEYEMNVLLYCAKKHIPIVELPIQTVYENNNSGSHFHVIRDSVKIYAVILKFVSASVAAFVIDFLLLLLVRHLTRGLGEELSLLVSVVSARVVSSLCNYHLNRRLVFAQGTRTSILKYYILAVTLLLLNYGLIWVFNVALPIPLAVAKIITELLLYPFSYIMQRRFVFAKKSEE